MRLTKIYTKKGDRGKTSLSGNFNSTGDASENNKVYKHNARICAFGDTDELNSFIGSFYSNCKEYKFNHQIVDRLKTIQNRLFDIGGELSFCQTDPLSNYTDKLLSYNQVKKLEQDIDTFSINLPPLKNFILPSGHRLSCDAHLCRSICRRTERSIALLASKEQVRAEILAYINRLSDWLFVAARVVGVYYQVTEVLWEQDK